MISSPKASFDAKWLVKEPCGTPAACTMSRTLAFANPRSWTTRRPSVRIRSRLDVFGISLITTDVHSLVSSPRVLQPSARLGAPSTGSAPRQARDDRRKERLFFEVVEDAVGFF